MMGEGLVPSDMFGLTEVAKNEGREYPIWKNFLENPSTVQFDHRILVGCRDSSHATRSFLF